MDRIKDVKMLVARGLLKAAFCAAVAASMTLQVCAVARVDVCPQCFEPGGWALAPQFMDVMGSPYLLAHGLGVRVMDAAARVDVPESGEWRVWVRTRRWVEGAGHFKVSVGGRTLPIVFGKGAPEWNWESGGAVRLEKGELEVRLTDLDGFDGRCAGVVLTQGDVPRFEAPLFCDATGDGWVGYWAGADWRMGREAKSEYGESLAPEKADGDTLGASLMWTSVVANAPMEFSAPWAEPHAQGVEAVNGWWNWEYGIHRDMIAEGEAIRDRLLLATYGAFSLAKRRPENTNNALNLCPFLLGKRESRRLLGDWVYSEKDVTSRRPFADAIASGSWGIDLHFDNYRPGVDFLTTCHGTTDHGETYGRYWIPYRSIYSRNVANLFMAGRCFSCTHVGLGGPRVMNTLAQLGVAAGEAAAMCRELGETPRGIYAHGHVRKLQGRLGGEFPGVPDPKLADWRIVDDESEGVKFGKGWQKRHVHYGDQVGEYAHFPGKKAEPAVYPLPVDKEGRYALMGRVPFSWGAKPGSKTVCELTSGGRVETFMIDQAIADGTWRKLGEFDLAPGATLKLLPAKSKGYVVADGFAVAPVSMPRSEVGTVRVCTYNIGWAAGSPTHPGCWVSRRADVAVLVCSNSLDVVAFQEVVPAQADYLRGKMPEYGFAGEYRNEDRTSGQGNLVAWRRDRFELVETRTFWLSETPDVPGSKSWGSGWRRTCTLAALREKRTGVRICVASVHLDCASSLAKEEGMRLVLRRLPDFSAGAPVILAGDFNSNETDTAPMLAAKEMTYALYASETPPSGPWGTTCAGFRRKSPPTSYADAQRVPLSERCTKEGTRRYGERIDYIFVSKGVRVLDYATYDFLRPGLDLYPSDHFPVVATLKFP